MTSARTKSRSKKQVIHTSKSHAHASRWARSVHDQRYILLTGLAYVLVVAAESAYVGVPLRQFCRIVYVLPLIIVKLLFTLLVLSMGTMLRGLFLPEAKQKRFFHRIAHAWNHMDSLATRYLDGEVVAYGVVGLLVMVANGFYFIQKSLVHVVHPYAWDDAFIAVDRFLHFGHSPDEFVVWIAQTFHLTRVLDIAYFLWFLIMYLSLGYTLFWDNNLRRRLRFLWCFLLSWILLGSVLAVWFSTAGPLFYHDFFPHRPDPYAGFVQYIKDEGPIRFPFAYSGGVHLLDWTTNGDLVNLNAVAAFPSLHIAIAWLATLYGFSIDRRLGWLGAGFCVLIYLATVLFGFHYALDSYVSLACVSLMWWVTGRLLDRAHAPDARLKRV